MKFICDWILIVIWNWLPGLQVFKADLFPGHFDGFFWDCSDHCHTLDAWYTTSFGSFWLFSQLLEIWELNPCQGLIPISWTRPEKSHRLRGPYLLHWKLTSFISTIMKYSKALEGIFTPQSKHSKSSQFLATPVYKTRNIIQVTYIILSFLGHHHAFL